MDHEEKQKSSRDDISAIYSSKLINLFEAEFSFQNGNFLKGNNYRDVKKIFKR